jgi:hypothetical protein
MRKLFLSFVFLLLFSCEEREFYNSVYLTVNNPIIKVEASLIDYRVGDVLFMNTDSFSSVLNEPNQATPIDVFRTSGSNFMRYFFTLEKNVSGQWIRVALSTSDIVVDRGIVNVTESINVGARYNGNNKKYESRVGVRLNAVGQYRLLLGESLENPSLVQFSSDQVNGFTTVVVASPLEFGTGFSYNFTVL